MVQRDESWIDAMDDLFATDRRFRAVQLTGAVQASRALFAIFRLGKDGFSFARPNLAEALRTDRDTVKEHLTDRRGSSLEDEPRRDLEVSSARRWS